MEYPRMLNFGIFWWNANKQIRRLEVRELRGLGLGEFLYKNVIDEIASKIEEHWSWMDPSLR